jgi:hypothetical protein
MTTLLTLLLVPIAAMVGKMSITFDYDQSANFGEFKTFKFVAPTPADLQAASAQFPTYVNQINEDRIQTSIISEMTSRGYTQSETPDLYVTYYIKLQTQTEYQANTVGMGGGPYGAGFYGGFAGYGGWGGMSTTTITPMNYETGTLVIDVVSSKTNTLVWYASGSGLLANANKAAQNIPTKISQLFEKYYWQAGQSAPVTPIPAKK